MASNINASGGNVFGRANAAADTVFYPVVPGKVGAIAAVSSFKATSGNTANNVYAMRALGTAGVATAFVADSGQALVLDADPSPTGNTIAAGDQVVVQCSDGTYRRAQVNTAGWNGTTKTVTFTANLAAAAAVGAKVWNFGVFTDTDPKFNLAHPLFTTTANAAVTYTFVGAGLRGHVKGEPLLFYCPNATNATVFDFIDWSHLQE